jgi:methionine synthase reductase
MEIIFNLVEFGCDQGRTYKRLGVATGFLSQLKPSDTIYFLKRKFQTFTFPKEIELFSNKKPMLMIGPGTGIAPFISFLRAQHHNLKKENDVNLWLFYGCRDPTKDFLYKKELCSKHSANLCRLSLSFSRIESLENLNEADRTLIEKYYSPNTKYVQNSMLKNATEIADLIYKQEAFVYVCGDAANMAKDVFNCFAQCLSDTFGLSADESNKYLLDLIKNKRYKQDIWA